MPRIIAVLAFASIAAVAHAQPVPVHILSGPIITVPPPVIDGPRPPALNPPAPPMEIPRATPLTTCDPGGCWDSTGRRLNRMGPVLTAPSGACAVEAGAVRCP